jgi:hypothetical protein
MQITKYWVTDFFAGVPGYTKLYNAIKLKGVPLISEDYKNGFFEVESKYAPTVTSVSNAVKIPATFFSTRTVADPKPPTPAPKQIVIPNPPTPKPPASNEYPAPPKDIPNEDNGSGKLIGALVFLGIITAFGKKKKGR